MVFQGPPALLLLCVSLLAAQTAPWPTTEWPTSTPEEQGMNAALLEQAARYVDTYAPTRFNLLVFRNGRLVFERYFDNNQPGDANNIKSVSKSVLSILTGIALDKGNLHSLDQKLYDFYQDCYSEGDDPRKQDVTIAHLMTMTGGFLSTETGALYTAWARAADRNCYVISLPLDSNPGERFNYSTGLTHLLSGILTQANQTPMLDFADEHLYAPLGISRPRWDRDSTGLYIGGSEVYLTARDLAKIGLLVLRNGMWDGRRIVSEEWLRRSTQLRVRTNSVIGDYGYLWWKPVSGNYPVHAGMGYGGQYMFLVPDLDLIMVTAARSNYSPIPDSCYLQPYTILSDYVIPAVQAPAPQISENGVVNAADYSNRVAAGSFASVFGSGFSLVSTNWDYAMPADGKLPPAIGGVRVTIGGRAAHASYVSPTQVNILVPPDLPAGRYRLDLNTTKGTSTQYIDVAAFAPALFTSVRDGVNLATPTPVRPGQEVALWLSGLGPSVPDATPGTVIGSPLPLANTPEVLVAGRRAQVVYAGLAFAGVWQVNVRIPDGVPAGMAPVEVRAGGESTQREAMIGVAP